MTTYFEILIIELYVFYAFKTHVKFHVNQMLFTIRSINLFLYIILDYKNSKFKHWIDNIVIYLWFYWYFEAIEDIKRKCNLTVDMSKFTFNNIYIYIYIYIQVEL